MRTKAAAEPIFPIIANVKVNGCSSEKKISSFLFIFQFTFYHYLATNLRIKKQCVTGWNKKRHCHFFRFKLRFMVF